MNTTEVLDKIYWVGGIDWELRDFHGYSTEKGSTYNSFLALDDKVTLFDGVKATATDQLFGRMSEITDPSSLDYLVLNHAEMDHTGGVPEIVRRANPEKIFCSAPCADALVQHFGKQDWPVEIVHTGDTLDLGKRTVKFLETKMLHWPDSMFSYLVEDKMLISSDAFGQHYATSARFDDEVEPGELMWQAAKYYANILLPYSPLILKLLEQVKSMGLEIDMIAPDHGVVWRKNVQGILNAYSSWASQKGREKAIVVFDTMWHSTEKMAHAVGDGLITGGMETIVMDLHGWHRSDVVTELLDAKGLVLGSPTLNNGFLPRIADFLCYAKGLRPQGKIGAAFGSYGWGGESVKLLNAAMDDMKVKRVDDGLRVKYVPTSQDLEAARDLGIRVADAIRESLS